MGWIQVNLFLLKVKISWDHIGYFPLTSSQIVILGPFSHKPILSPSNKDMHVVPAVQLIRFLYTRPSYNKNAEYTQDHHTSTRFYF